mgnify:CR=1 FL=1
MNTQQIVTTKNGLQKIGKPVSAELPKVKDPNVNLRDRLNDILLTEKQNLSNYQTGINEMINDDLRQVLIDNRNRLQGIQIKFFDEMFNLGEYQADLASPAQIADSTDVFTGYKSQLPIPQ